MNLLEKFENLLKSKYIFHLHTNYTDGLNSVEEYCSWASENGYNAIVFTEHVRKNLSYDFYSFLSDMENARQKFANMDIWIGVEAKILPNGDLDIPDKILPEIQVICFACHSFPKDIDLYEKSFKTVFSDNRWKSHIRVWVHPGHFLKRLGVMDDYLHLLSRLVSCAVREDVFIEHNLKYELPPMSIMKNIPGSKLVRGLDAHSVESMAKLAGGGNK